MSHSLMTCQVGRSSRSIPLIGITRQACLRSLAWTASGVEVMAWAKCGEAEVLAAGRAGRVLDCADRRRGARRLVNAELICRCCHDLKAQIDPRGLRLRNAVVAGSLDLAGLDVPFPLRFEECEFDEAPIAEGGVFWDLAFTGCAPLPGLLANGIRVRNDLDLSRSLVTGRHATTASTSRRAAIWLCESDIGGRLLCADTVIRSDGERSIQADRMHVGGTVRFLHQFAAYGGMRLLGASIDGSFDLTGAHLVSPVEPALDLRHRRQLVPHL